MGLIKGELVRNVFFSNSKNKSINGNNHDQAQERKKWSKMRSYLCGDEFNSVLAEHDSDSFRSFSTAISSQPLHQKDLGEEEEEGEEAMIMKSTTESSELTITQPISVVEKKSSTADLFREEDAAITIQSAFRNFQARQRTKQMIETEEESIGTSLEVQTGNSIVQEKLTKKLHQKARTGCSSSLKLKEDWDDSTVSSNISKMRIQNRVEAMTRRERALAYAFSQQLRICSKKKEPETSTDHMAWSWLERWMATRLPENNNNSIVESHNGNKDQSFIMRKRLLDIAVEEKESCGSNEVSSTLQIESIVTKNRVKPPRTVSRKKVNKKED